MLADALHSLEPVAPLLVHSARRWLAEQHGGAHFARGAAGIVDLARRIERWKDAPALRDASAESQHESQWTEGAGSAFALLLLDYFGRGEHAHRGERHLIRFDTYGYFDPFAPVAHAIQEEQDGPPARVLLTRAASLAEQERHGTGPSARMWQTFEAVLAEHTPHVTIVDHFDCTAWLSCDAEVQLGRFRPLAQQGDLDVLASALRKLLQPLRNGNASLHTASHGPRELLGRVLPRITSSAFHEQLPSASLVQAPWVGDLWISLVEQDPHRMRYVRNDELRGLGMALPDVMRHALDNLAKLEKPVRLRPAHTTGLFEIRAGDGLDSSRILLPAVRSALHRALGADIAVSLPHRDMLYACSLRDVHALRALRDHTELDARRAPHRLSSQVFALRSGTVHSLADNTISGLDLGLESVTA
jgi:hypothetical protein